MKTDDFPLFVVTQDASDDRVVSIPSMLDAYERAGSVAFAANEKLPTPFVARSELPVLEVKGTSKTSRARNDVTNAIRLHTWLREVFRTRRDARDNRLWIWLAHEVFPAYCRARWAPLTTEMPARINNIRSHWFLRGEGRGAVGDHALARLWWAAEATHCPADDTSVFETKRGDDEYRYTAILLGYQNVHLQIRDRTFGASRRILLCALEALRVIREEKESVDSAAAVLGKEINLISRYRSLDTMRPLELVKLFTRLARMPQGRSRRAGNVSVE